MAAAAESKVPAARQSAFALAAAALLTAGGCGRAPEPPQAGTDAIAGRTTAAPMPPEMQKIQDKLDMMADQTQMEKEQDAGDRAELVTPAPAGYQPKFKGRRLELELFAQKTMLRAGETFWYRAEIRNVGSEPVSVRDPFVKSGFLNDWGSRFKLSVTPRHWKDSSVLGSAAPCESEGLPIPGWGLMDAGQRADAAKRYRFQAEVLRTRVNITLNPGEVLRTRDERYVSSEEKCSAFKAGKEVSDRAGGLFRQYYETRDFDRPGTYSLQLTLNDVAEPLSEEKRKSLRRDGFSDAAIRAYEETRTGTHLGRAESNVLKVEVVR